MKKVVLLLAIITFSLYFSAKQINDLQLFGYNGQIHQIIITNYINGVLSDVKIMEFNLEGNLVYEGYTTQDVDKGKSLYESQFHEIYYTYIYEGDKFIKRYRKTHEIDDDYISFERSEFDQMSNEIRRVEYMSCDYEFEQLVEHRFMYDNNNRVIEIVETHYNSDETISWHIKTTFEYTEDGSVIKTYEGRELNRTISNTFDKAGKPIYIKVMDSKGNVVFEKPVELENLLYFGNGSNISKYDEKYNVIKKWSSSEYGDISRTETKIVYYDNSKEPYSTLKEYYFRNRYEEKKLH